MIKVFRGVSLTPPGLLHGQLGLRGWTVGREGITTRLSGKKGTQAAESIFVLGCVIQSQGWSQESWAPVQCGHWLLGGLRPVLPLSGPQFPSSPGIEVTLGEAELPRPLCRRILHLCLLRLGMSEDRICMQVHTQVRAGSEHRSRGVLMCTS